MTGGDALASTEGAWLSIVVGAPSARPSPAKCLAALADQIDDGVEVIVVAGGPIDVAIPGWARWLIRSGGLVPQRLGPAMAGVAASIHRSARPATTLDARRTMVRAAVASRPRMFQEISRGPAGCC